MLFVAAQSVIVKVESPYCLDCIATMTVKRIHNVVLLVPYSFELEIQIYKRGC
jgi:hypothetical protein